MVVGVLRLELQLYAPGSLKEKRSIVQSLLGRCRQRFPVSCAETGLNDQWQRAELGFAMLGGERTLIEKVFTQIEDEIVRSGQAEINHRLADMLQY
jgi:hypothetical protein